MDKNALWKWLVLVVLTSASLAVVYPPREKIKLGLDLKGGTSFTLQIDRARMLSYLREQSPDLSDSQLEALMPEKIKQAQEQALEIIRNRVDALGIAEPAIYPEKHDRVVVQIPGLKEEDRRRAENLIKSAAFLEFSMVHDDSDKLTGDLFEKGIAPTGYVLYSGGGQRERYYYARDPAVPDEKLDEAFRAELEKFHAPRGYRFLLNERIEEGRKLYIPYFVRTRAELTGETLKSARVEYDQLNRPYVSLVFDSKGARQFARITEQNAPGGEKNPSPDGRRYLAIVLDGRLYSAPFIKTAIYGGRAIIEGDFTMKEAHDLRIVLSSGSMPTPVDIIETRGVDPSLGRDSIRSGARAAALGAALVAVFMLVYYMVCGVAADIALLFNLILLPLGMMIASGFLGLFSGEAARLTSAISLPVLTLPGIAGIALTMGMAVDANVLIYERIREELKAGKRLLTAVEAGYSRAFITIVDSNITTIFAAVILFIAGSGPVRGFGVTLIAGIIVSMYTALMLTRMLITTIIRSAHIQSIKMLSLFKQTAVDFIKVRKLVMLCSAAVIVVAWALMTVSYIKKPGNVMGIDFTGGASLVFRFDKKADTETVRRAIAAAGVRDASIQYQRDPAEGSETLYVRAGFDDGEKVKQALETSLGAEYGYNCVSEDLVGPQVGGELLARAGWALLWAMAGMIVYISVRFRFAYAIGAITAVLHDILVCLGIFYLFGRQINLPIVAALLAIIGYSVNDTIVIFDRIRENVNLMRGRKFLDICNISINATISRTVLTSLTTLITVAMLLVFGGGAIFDFALVFFIGIIVGTYSSIFIATPVMIAIHHTEKPETE